MGGKVRSEDRGGSHGFGAGPLGEAGLIFGEVGE